MAEEHVMWDIKTVTEHEGQPWAARLEAAPLCISWLGRPCEPCAV